MQKWLFSLTILLLLSGGILLQPLQPGAQALGDSCNEWIVNGDMESDAGWVFPVTAVQGAYSTEQFFSPARSARLGIVSGENKYAYSSMNQSVAPSSGTQLILSWHAFPLSQPQDINDLQYVQIRDKTGALHTIWSGKRDDAAWLACSYDISDYLNQNITLYFGVKNDGANGKTAIYVDDVSLQSCSSPQTIEEGCHIIHTTPTPTASPTATPTASATPIPTPTNTPMPTETPTATPAPTSTPPPCQQLVQNPGFEQGYAGWQQNLYVTARYRDETGEERIGAWFGGAEYTDQYLYQDVTIPANSSGAHLSFLWAFAPPSQGQAAPEDALSISLRRPDGSLLQSLTTIDNANTPRRWQSASFDLSAYVGQTVRFYAQSSTGASTTSWYLDQIELFNCTPSQHTTYLPLITK